MNVDASKKPKELEKEIKAKIAEAIHGALKDANTIIAGKMDKTIRRLSAEAAGKYMKLLRKSEKKAAKGKSNSKKHEGKGAKKKAKAKSELGEHAPAQGENQ